MATQENLIESIVELMNKHFDMQVSMNEENLPYVTYAKEREQDSLTQFINEFIRLTEEEHVGGKMNYYFDHELDYDTPEEYHRY